MVLNRIIRFLNRDNTPMDCVYCEQAVSDVVEAVKHHSDEHPTERFDPLWYSDPEDWEEVDELPDEVEKHLQ